MCKTERLYNDGLSPC